MGFPVNKTGSFKTMLDAISGNIALAGYSNYSDVPYIKSFNIDLSLNTANINLTEDGFVPFDFIEPKKTLI